MVEEDERDREWWNEVIEEVDRIQSEYIDTW